MSERTEIAWTDSTFNPWIGCQKVGPGCDYCYAEREFDHRHHRAKWGPGQERVRTSVHNWNQPLRWNKKPFYECDCGWRGDKLDEHTRACGYPEIGRIRPARRRVFCASLSDVFDNAVPAQWRADLLRLIADTPNLDWLLLTKRIGNVQKMMVEAFSMGWPNHASTWERWPDLFRNIWLGASICNQEEADRDIPKLLAVPARVRFVSMEPLLGPVDLRLLEYEDAKERSGVGTVFTTRRRSIDWVIVGGESGPKARPMHPDWVRSLRDQCAAAGVPFLHKQNGEFANADAAGLDENVCYDSSTTGGWLETDGALTLGENAAPQRPGAIHIFRVGKKAAGRLLDGKLHNEFPEVAP